MIILDSSNTLPVRVSAPQDPMETLLQKDPLPGEGGEPPLKNFPEEDFVGSASHVLPPGDAPGLEDPAVDLVPPSRIFLPSLDSDLLPEDRREKSAYEQRLYASFAEELSTDLIRKREILARLDDPAKVMIGGEQPDLARFRGARQTASRLNRTLSILHLLLFAGSLGPPETQALPFAWEQIPPLTHPWFQIADLRVAIWSMERKLLRIRSGLAEPNELRERRKMKEPVETAEMVEPVMPETGTAPAPAPAPAPAVPRADSP